MNVNGEERNEIGLVRIHYAEGFTTVLPNHPHLACRVALLGSPTRVRLLGSARYCAEWDLPGRVESHTFGNPWPLDRRAVVHLEVCPAAFDAVMLWLMGLRFEALRKVGEAELALKALRHASTDVERRSGVLPRVASCGEVGCSFCDSDNA